MNSTVCITLVTFEGADFCFNCLRNFVPIDMESPFLCKVACNVVCSWYKFDRVLSTTCINESRELARRLSHCIIVF